MAKNKKNNPPPTPPTPPVPPAPTVPPAATPPTVVKKPAAVKTTTTTTTTSAGLSPAARATKTLKKAAAKTKNNSVPVGWFLLAVLAVLVLLIVMWLNNSSDKEMTRSMASYSGSCSSGATPPPNKQWQDLRAMKMALKQQPFTKVYVTNPQVQVQTVIPSLPPTVLSMSTPTTSAIPAATSVVWVQPAAAPIINNNVNNNVVNIMDKDGKLTRVDKADAEADKAGVEWQQQFGGATKKFEIPSAEAGGTVCPDGSLTIPITINPGENVYYPIQPGWYVTQDIDRYQARVDMFYNTHLVPFDGRSINEENLHWIRFHSNEDRPIHAQFRAYPLDRGPGGHHH